MPTINQLSAINILSAGDNILVYAPNEGDTRRASLTSLMAFIEASLVSPNLAPVTKTADFTLADAENYIINNKSGSACVVTLPAASNYTGRVVVMKTIQAQAINSASSNVVPLAGGAAGTAIVSGTAGNWAELVSDGINWIIMKA